MHDQRTWPQDDSLPSHNQISIEGKAKQAKSSFQRKPNA